MHYTRGYVDRGSGSSDDGLLRFIAATEGVKGDGIELKMSGAKLERYRANPIFGYGHRYWSRGDLPIGRSREVELIGQKLRIGVEFDQEDEFAVEIERKYRKQYLHAVSVGFEVTKWENDQGSYWRGGVAEEWELLEVSAVPVPMDASAVVESGRSLLVTGTRDGQPVLEVDPEALAGLVWDRLHAELRDLGVIPAGQTTAGEPGVADLLESIEEVAACPARLEEVRRLGVERGWWGPVEPYTINVTPAVSWTLPSEQIDTLVRGALDRYADRGAIPAHNTAVTEGEWDGPAAVANCPADKKSLRAIHAWVESDGDKDAKGSYKFPHHATPGGPANLSGVRNALARLPQSDIPEADRAAVERHLRNHLDAQKKDDDHPGGQGRTVTDPAAGPEPVSPTDPDPNNPAPEPAAPDERGAEEIAAQGVLAALTYGKE